MWFAVVVMAIGLAGSAVAQQVAPPDGAKLLFEVDADGVQTYACEARDGRFAWVFKGPEAALFDAAGRQVGTHGAGPHWRLSDGSEVIGQVTASAPAPVAGAVPWLLLRAMPRETAGGLRHVAWVRRFETRSGVPPPDGCDAGHGGAAVRMRYFARYAFFTD